MGYKPTVFEKLPVAGGMLAVGIPDYRLPKDVLEREIHGIEALGVEIVTDTALGKDITLTQLHQQGYEAFFIAMGAHRGRKLGITGEDLNGVVQAIDFLRDVNLKTDEIPIGHSIAVVGGGNAAIDAARSARRMGADHVYVLYRRTRNEMPAQSEEIEAADAEGIEFRFLVTPSEIIGDGGKVRAIECQPMELGSFDRSGRRVIPAISQSPDTAHLLDDFGIETTTGGLIRVDSDGSTNVPNVFAGGDVSSGPSLVINAIAAGERGAVSIDQYLDPDETRIYPWRQKKPADTPFDPNAEPVQYGRCEAPALPAASRRVSFCEVEGTIDADTAVREARRCLRCDYRETEE